MAFSRQQQVAPKLVDWICPSHPKPNYWFQATCHGRPSEKAAGDVPKTPFMNLIFTEILIPVFTAAACFIPYTFINAQTGIKDAKPVNSVLRIVICTLAPIVINAGALMVLVFLSCCMGPLLGMCCKTLRRSWLALRTASRSLSTLSFSRLCGCSRAGPLRQRF